MNFYPFHIGDYISHTSHLSDLEDLAYRRMMDLYYQLEKPFHQSLDIARKIKSTRAIVDQLLPEFFEWNEEDKSWHNKRADEEISKYHAKADSARNANRIKSEKITVMKSALKSETYQNVTKNQEPITINHKPIKNIAPPEGVDLSLWNDYLKVRKAAKKPLTDTALKGLIREAEKAKITLSDALQTCCERSWVGFKAEWVQETAKSAKELPLGTNEQIMHAYEHECGKDPKQARFNSYYEMKSYIVQQREIRAKS